MADKLKITIDGADGFRAPLAGQWGLDVEAACIVRQGHSPSMASAMVGVGVVKLFAPKKGKGLPRKFVLAVTPDRVLAFKASHHSRGEGPSAVMHVTIEPGEIVSWSRSEVSMRSDEGGMNPNATLALAGVEIPCTVPDNDAEEAFGELVAALSNP